MVDSPIALILVSREQWKKPRGDGRPSLDQCAQEIAACGRRLSKGVDLSSERSRLTRLTAMVREAVSELSLRRPGSFRRATKFGGRCWIDSPRRGPAGPRR